jgi:predicted O-methyltransferase YrrM
MSALMPLPATVRRLAPTRIRDSERLRSFALGAGLIPPRPMHTEDEADLLARLAQGRRTVVEIGTYEGSSAVVLAEAMSLDSSLHLIDSYEGNALLFGWQGTERATRRLMERVTRERGGPRVEWHVARSGDVARGWSTAIDLLFIDGDHTEAGARADWDAFSPFVAVGGVVTFHDARSGHPGGPHAHPGPTAVVDSLFRGDAPVDGWRIVEEVDSVVAVERSQ